MKLIATMAVSVSLLVAQTERPALHSVTAVRHWSLSGVTRVAIEVSGDFRFRSDRLHNPERVYFDIPNSRPRIDSRRLYSVDLDDKLVKRVRVAETLPGVTRVVLELSGDAEIRTSQLTNPNRLMVEVRGMAPGAETTAGSGAGGRGPGARAPEPTILPETAPALPAVVKASPPKVEPPAPSAALPVETPKAASGPPVVVKSSPPKVGLSAPTAALPAPSVPPVENPKAAPAPPVVVKASPPKAELPAPAVAFPAPPVPPVEPHKVASAPPVVGKSSPPKVELPAPAVAFPAPPASPAESPRAAKHTSTGSNSLTRALGLKVGRIAIDAGHGGHDQGTEGPKGLLEKDLVLDVATRLGKLIEDRMGAEVIYTRSDDTFIPLEERTQLANEKKADLFLSIHANSSPYPRIAGIETFYLNFSDSKEALDVAARENASSQKPIFELQDIIQKITKHDKAEESKEFAGRVQAALYAFSARNVPGERNRGVKKAPFVVLIGANMPSVLAEIGFLSNPREEALLKKPDYRQKLAEALYRGVTRYAEGLSHFQVAQK